MVLIGIQLTYVCLKVKTYLTILCIIMYYVQYLILYATTIQKPIVFLKNTYKHFFYIIWNFELKKKTTEGFYVLQI